MDIQIRSGVFETNSSSSHSLTLAPGELQAAPFNKETLRAGIVVAKLDEFGWGWRRYYSAQNKLNYLLTQFTHGQLPAGGDQALTETLLEEEPRAAMMAKVVKEHTGCVLRFTQSSGYVDHQSMGVALEVFESEEKLRDFLFNPNCFVETGNDNSPPPFEIATDRGREYFYGDRVVEPPADYVAIELTSAEIRRMDGFMTAGGALLSAEINPELYHRLKEEGIVEAVHYDTSGRWNYFEHEEPGSSALRELVDSGLKLAPRYRGSYDYRKTNEMGERKLSLHVRVPAQLAQGIGELPATPATLLQLVESLLDYEHTASWLKDANWLKKPERAEHERKHKAAGRALDRLFNQAGVEGVLF